MATTPFLSPYLTTFPQGAGNHITRPARAQARSSQRVIRRPTREQGQALEILGHAIEYLIDSQLYQPSSPVAHSTVQAEEILMRVNREVFAECAEVTPLGQRVRDWFLRQIGNAR